ncbi:MAG TPA: hypothetical protein PKA64_11055 [Myxococcota bacterium]|nr:hypothetical protein [Myxococcota bacterium]
MASLLNLTLNAPASVNRDAKVELIHQLSGKKTEVTPYLDGTAAVRGLADGAYTMRVTHPNFTFPLITQDIRVFPDRPTFVPIVIPPDLLTFTAIEDRPDANLGPVQSALEAGQGTAARQGNKKGGEPIYAADWNELAGAVAGIATATQQMTRLVSVDGHNHPELEKKIGELDSNLQKFFDIFGRTVVELQRQIQQIALQRQVDDAFNAARLAPDDSSRLAIKSQIDKLALATHDPPAVYTRKAQEVGRAMEAALSAVAPHEEAPPEAADLLATAAAGASALTTVKTVLSYREEAENISRIGQTAGLSFRTIAKQVG